MPPRDAHTQTVIHQVQKLGPGWAAGGGSEIFRYQKSGGVESGVSKPWRRRRREGWICDMVVVVVVVAYVPRIPYCVIKVVVVRVRTEVRYLYLYFPMDGGRDGRGWARWLIREGEW